MWVIAQEDRLELTIRANILAFKHSCCLQVFAHTGKVSAVNVLSADIAHGTACSQILIKTTPTWIFELNNQTTVIGSYILRPKDIRQSSGSIKHRQQHKSAIQTATQVSYTDCNTDKSAIQTATQTSQLYRLQHKSAIQTATQTSQAKRKCDITKIYIYFYNRFNFIQFFFSAQLMISLEINICILIAINVSNMQTNVFF
ncbi:hypothetical protein Btru_006862 [Bulinus truncatus]|nr:hypothetical protein Btru_006862 [Bulinus truncatus]